MDGDDDVTLDALTPGVSVFQRRKGHRFSSDDLVTAWVAMQVHATPTRVLDLGCGLGSVLLHLAWSAPAATLVGVEAQDVSFALLQRNVAHNALGHRVRVHHGDLRYPAVIATLGGPFDLVTGTPPYFPVNTATGAADGQRAYARIEHRGGVEAYVATAAQVMTADGWFVLCADADADDRLIAAATTHDLAVHRRCPVIPRAGRRALFTVWAVRRDGVPGNRVDSELTLRDADGERTADARALRAFSGFAERSPG